MVLSLLKEEVITETTHRIIGRSWGRFCKELLHCLSKSLRGAGPYFDTPEKILLIHILNRSVVDLKGLFGSDGSGDLGMEHMAKCFFYSEDEPKKFFSFSIICEYLNVDKLAFRKALYELKLL